MDDVPSINPVKPLWPKRPDEQNRDRRRPKQDEEEAREHPAGEDTQESPGKDDDGHIDEYV